MSGRIGDRKSSPCRACLLRPSCASEHERYGPLDWPCGQPVTGKLLKGHVAQISSSSFPNYCHGLFSHNIFSHTFTRHPLVPILPLHLFLHAQPSVARMKLPATGMYPRITKLIFDEWQEVWDCCAVNKLRAIRPIVGDYKQKTYLSRRDAALLNRLRIDHTRLTHSYLLSLT